MNHKRKIAGLLIIGMAAVLSAFVKFDDDPIAKIAGQLDKWLSDHPQEKVYLQLDKPYYAAGDEIWFKAYLVVGAKHRLSAVSGVLNVELIVAKRFIRPFSHFLALGFQIEAMWIAIE